MKARLRLLRDRLKITRKRTLDIIFAVIVSIAFLASILYFHMYMSTPSLDISVDDGLEPVSLHIVFSDESRENFEGFAETMDVSVHLFSPSYGSITMNIPISNATALSGRDFALVSNSVDWSFSYILLREYEGDRSDQTTIYPEVNASNPSKAIFQMPSDIQTAQSFNLWANLKPLNVSKSPFVFWFSIRLNESAFNITESFFPPPELQLSHAPFYDPHGEIQISDLGIIVKRSGSETFSSYLLRWSDLYIEMQHFEKNIYLVIATFLFTSSVILLRVFLEVRKLFAKRSTDAVEKHVQGRLASEHDRLEKLERELQETKKLLEEMLEKE